MGERLEEKLAQAKMTQSELADHVGVSQQFISYLVKGWKKPSVDLLKRIAAALNCRMEDLI